MKAINGLTKGWRRGQIVCPAASRDILAELAQVLVLSTCIGLTHKSLFGNHLRRTLRDVLRHGMDLAKGMNGEGTGTQQRPQRSQIRR